MVRRRLHGDVTQSWVRGGEHRNPTQTPPSVLGTLWPTSHRSLRGARTHPGLKVPRSSQENPETRRLCALLSSCMVTTKVDAKDEAAKTASTLTKADWHTEDEKERIPEGPLRPRLPLAQGSPAAHQENVPCTQDLLKGDASGVRILICRYF